MNLSGDIIKELVSLGLKNKDNIYINEVRNKDGIYLYKVRYNNDFFVLKYFINDEYKCIFNDKHEIKTGVSHVWRFIPENLDK